MKQRLYRDICIHGQKMFMDKRAVRRNVDAIKDMVEATGPEEIIWPGFKKVAGESAMAAVEGKLCEVKCARNRLTYT
jgi:hypothetical protein